MKIYVTVNAEDTGMLQGCAGHDPIAFESEHDALSYVQDEPSLAVAAIEYRPDRWLKAAAKL